MNEIRPETWRVDANELDMDDERRMTYEGHPFTGVAFECFADGRLRNEVAHVNGLGQGVSRTWREDGSLADEEELWRGVLHGRSRGWSATGVLEREAVYELGMLVQKAELSATGEVLSVWTEDPLEPTLVMYRRSYPSAPAVPDLTRRR